MVTIGCALLLAMNSAAATSAGTTTDDAESAPRPQIVLTHEMNPEVPRAIEGWWSDGTGLLELRSDGRFRIWPTLDRFLSPSDVGRWHRENHAVFWLDSYRIPKQPRKRIPLWLRDGSLMATLDPEEQPFSKMLVVPTVPAESIMGVWTCGDHRLQFDPDLRWSHRIAAPAGQVPVRRERDEGTWRMGLDGVLHMEPATSNPPPVTRLIRDDDGRLVGLGSKHGVFVRVPRVSKIDESNPDGRDDEGDAVKDRPPIQAPSRR